MSITSIINDPDLALDRHPSNIFILTMRKAPENRIDSAYAQKLIAAYNLIRTTLGPDSEGAVITRGNDAKFWCTVSDRKKKKKRSTFLARSQKPINEVKLTMRS